MNAPDAETSRFARYAQFALLVLAAGALFPIMYLRQNFEVSLIEALHITASDLGDLNFILGAVVAVSYIPSGILADMVQPRLLMSFSLLVVGALGFWMSTYPSLLSLKIIFFGWGIAGGLCFWASMRRRRSWPKASPRLPVSPWSRASPLAAPSSATRRRSGCAARWMTRRR
jgi:sugar phosphate permease